MKIRDTKRPLSRRRQPHVISAPSRRNPAASTRARTMRHIGSSRASSSRKLWGNEREDWKNARAHFRKFAEEVTLFRDDLWVGPFHPGEGRAGPTICRAR